MFELSRDSSLPLVDQIVERFSSLIREGKLPPAARVPSIRKLAKLIGASPFTVADAYDRLVARGLIESRSGRGFFVSSRRAGGTLAVIEAMPDPGEDAFALVRATLSDSPDVIAAGSGFLPANWLLDALPSGILTRILRSRRAEAWLPGPPQGLPELREQLSARLLALGIPASAANIVTTVGASQAFDLIAHILLSPGDVVLVEDPAYFVLFEQLRAHHVRLVPIPRLSNGPDVDALEAACRAHRPRAFFVQSVMHNPTGTTAEPSVCHRVLSLAEQYGFAIIEDDVYGDLYCGSAVRLAQIDGLRHVIYVSSFTKIIGPALRVGYVAADAQLVTQLIRRKMLSILFSAPLGECIVSEALGSGRFKRYVEMVVARLAHLRPKVRAALSAAGVTVTESGEGIFLWGTVPDAVDVDDLVRRARASSILLAHGALFSPSGGCTKSLRFNVGHSTSPELHRFLSDALRAAA